MLHVSNHVINSLNLVVKTQKLILHVLIRLEQIVLRQDQLAVAIAQPFQLFLVGVLIRDTLLFISFLGLLILFALLSLNF